MSIIYQQWGRGPYMLQQCSQVSTRPPRPPRGGPSHPVRIHFLPSVYITRSSWQVGNVNLSTVHNPHMNTQLYSKRICSVDNYIIKQSEKKNVPWFNRTGQVHWTAQSILCKSSWQVGHVNLSAVNSPYMNKQLYTERICSVDNYIIRQRKKNKVPWFNRYGSGWNGWTSIRGCNVTIRGCKITC